MIIELKKDLTNHDIEVLKLLLIDQQNEILSVDFDGQSDDEIREFIDAEVWDNDSDSVELYIKNKYGDEITEEEITDIIEEYNLRDLQHDIIYHLESELLK